MRIATLGINPVLTRRRRMIPGMAGVKYVGHLSDSSDPPSAADLNGIDAVFLGAATADRYRLASAVLRCGVHLFLEWPPAASMRECSDLVRLADEAGLACTVSRPLRFCPRLKPAADGGRADIVSMVLRREPLTSADEGSVGLSPGTAMADAVDLACFLTKSSSVRRVDAAAANGKSGRRDATLFSLRFHSGAYAQVLIRMDGSAPRSRVYAAGENLHIDGALEMNEDALLGETEAFITALRERRTAAVSAFDALQTMRIVERLQSVLR